MFFGGKKEKRLTEEIAALRAERERYVSELEGLKEQRARMAEHLEHINTSRVQMKQDLEQVEDHIRRMEVLSEGSEQTAGDVHSSMIEMNNAVGTFDVNHSVFVKKRKEQDEKIMEVVENNKHFTTPMKYISEFPPLLREDYAQMKYHVAQMKEASHHISVLSLNAAIEASRMGESGSKFVASAEEVRSSSAQYEKEAEALSAKLQEAEERMDALEEQVHHLNELLKENNISMSHLLTNGMNSMASYESGQIGIRGILSDSAIGKTDSLQNSEREITKIEERMSLQMSDIRDEFSSQGNHIKWMEELLESDGRQAPTDGE